MTWMDDDVDKKLMMKSIRKIKIASLHIKYF